MTMFSISLENNLQKYMFIRILSLFFAMAALLSGSVLQAQSVGLVLSGGGAKGLSHIGVIRALEENEIPIDYVAGTSIGSIVGGMYAAGLSPEDMIAVIKTKEFHAWYTGVGEREFFSYLYSGYPTPAMLKLKMQKDDSPGTNGKSKAKFLLPTSIVSSYPMDIAFIQIFANAAAAAGYDFSNLMVPFFCVSADILKKQEFISDKGDLGSAIRASMTFPAYFKPITIDSVVLFDGGFYNNFPWEAMQEKYNPDYIIGVKCVRGKKINPEQDSPYKLLETMMTQDTDYDIPTEDGIVVAGIYDYGLMDFDKIDELVQKGYDTAMKYMDRIKLKVKARRPKAEVDSMRLAFRQKCPNLHFDSICVNGNMTADQKEFVSKTITDKKESFSYSEAKRGYYRIVSTNSITSMYPLAVLHTDSTYTMKLDVKPQNALSLSVGGNISSTALMQGYLGLSHIHFSKHPWNIALNLDVGQFFTGVGLYFRQHIGIKPLFLYEIMLNAHRFDYFGSSQSILFSNSLAKNIREDELYMTFNMGTPISYLKSVMLEFGITGGRNYYEYFQTDTYTKYDKPDKTLLSYLTGRLKVAQTTLDYELYPTSGRRGLLEARYIFGSEKHTEGTIYQEVPTMVRNPYKNVFFARLSLDDYYSISKWFSLGYGIDFTYTTGLDMCDYYSTLIATPAFQPTQHSRTLMLPAYRAPFYLGVTVSPVLKFTEKFFLHITAGYFQPYRSLVETANGDYEYSAPFPMGGFMGNAAFVWQSPIGPVSLSCAYYDKAEKAKWYPSFNIGFLIFRKKGLIN